MPKGHAIPEDVREEIIDLCAEAIAEGQFKSSLKRIVRACLKGSEHEDVSTVTIERIITDARVKVRESAGITKEDGQTDAIAFYQKVLRDPNASNIDKLRARERIDKLLGLENKTGQIADAEEVARVVRDEIIAQEALYE